MQDSGEAGGLIARAANRFLGKADREASSVMSNAQRHPSFLDSPRIAKVLSRSNFHFSDLRHRITSVFLVLPPNRMDAYSRWLRSGPPGHRTGEASVTPKNGNVATHTLSQRLKAPNRTLEPALVPAG
jgi:type IV secretion system protein VirD4